MKIFQRKIILASKSPRRKQLLTEAGFDFEIRVRSIDESYPDDMAVQDVAPFLAEQKAEAAKDLIHGAEILLTADSVVILDETIYGKPKDRADAIHILRQLSGKTHQVITGVCLYSSAKKRVFAGISNVHMAPLSEEEILFYVDRYQPFDKAGAYAIQEWIGLCKISKIEGTYSNIMGLPMSQLYWELEQFLP